MNPVAARLTGWSASEAIGRELPTVFNVLDPTTGDPTGDPEDSTLFRGETLRGLLLNGYAFWKLGQLALIGSIAAFALAALMFLLTILGFWHLRRVAPTDQIFAPARDRSLEPALT